MLPKLEVALDAPVPLHAPDCPLCGGEQHRTVLQGARDLVWRKPGTFQLQRCEGCALVTTRPRPTSQGLGTYYEGTYSGSGEESQHDFERGEGVGGWVMRYRLSVLQRVRALGADDHLLDVGCNRGGFLRIAQEGTGCQVSGIDFDAGSIDNALQLEGVEYRTGRLVDADYAPGSFTAVTFLESLEHHERPIDALRKAHELLAPGGVCFVEVPNFDGFWRRVFGRYWLPLLIPQHLFHFTPDTLKAAMHAAGFEQVQHQQTMFYPLEGVASLGLMLGAVLRMPPPGSPISWRTPLDVLVVINLVLLYFVWELPSQLLLRLVGAAGHQVAVAIKAP